MTGWAVRGIGTGLVNVVVRLVLGAAVAQWPTNGSALRWVAFAVVILVVIVWAGFDGIRDRRANPDPDRGQDLTMMWLAAAAVGGLLAGLLAWIIDFFVDFSLGQNGLLFELTSGAAFTILTIFISSAFAVFVGRQLVGREAKSKLAASDTEHAHKRDLVHANAAKHETNQEWTAEHSDADTEVFPAVESEDRPSQSTPGGRHGTSDGS